MADKLDELFRNNREDFEKKWDDIKLFIVYGLLSDDKFYEKAIKINLLKTIEDKYFTVDEYIEKIKPLQTDKEGTTIALYCSNTDEQHAYIEAAKGKGYDVLIMDTPLDSHLVSRLEQSNEKLRFTRVDADTIEKLINKEDAQPSKLSEEEQNNLKPVFEGQVEAGKFTVTFESLSETDQPVIITRPEFMRRMKDMSVAGGGNNMFGMMPEMFNLVVNANHPLTNKILVEADKTKQEQLAKQACDLALLSQGLLKGEELTRFIKRSVDLID